MTLTELKYIVAVAREKHFGKGAEACHVSALEITAKRRYGNVPTARASKISASPPLGQ